MRTLPLVFLFCSGLALAQTPVQITAKVDKLHARLGETIVLTEDVSNAKDLPKPESLTFPPFEVRDAVQTTLPGQQTRYTIRLAAYEDGKKTIPPLKIGDAESKPLTIDVQRAAPAQGATLHDLKPLTAIDTPWWMKASLGLLLLPLLALLRKKRRSPRQLTPDEVALKELDRLTAEELPARLHYDRLAHILRTYLARRFQLPVLEHTTHEVVQMLPIGSQVGPILNEADLVKFARQDFAREQALTQVGAVREVVVTTRPAKEA